MHCECFQATCLTELHWALECCSNYREWLHTSSGSKPCLHQRASSGCSLSAYCVCCTMLDSHNNVRSQSYAHFTHGKQLSWELVLSFFKSSPREKRREWPCISFLSGVLEQCFCPHLLLQGRTHLPAKEECQSTLVRVRATGKILLWSHKHRSPAGVNVFYVVSVFDHPLHPPLH